MSFIFEFTGFPELHYCRFMKFYFPLMMAAIVLTSGCAAIHTEHRVISGGEAIDIEVVRMWPWDFNPGNLMDPASNEFVEVPHSVGIETALPPGKGVQYSFALKWKDADSPTSVIVEDVTDAEAVVLVNDAAPHLTNTPWAGSYATIFRAPRNTPRCYWVGVSPVLQLWDPNLGWLQTKQDTVRIYRFNVTTASGNSFQLYQAKNYCSGYLSDIQKFNPTSPAP